MGEWIVPFEKRGHSGAHGLNFLWRSEQLYVMDNHRAALWCWWRHLPESSEWQLFHLDRHYDTLRSRLDDWLALIPEEMASLPQYLELAQTIDGHDCPVIQWDNYLSIFLARHRDRVTRTLFATAQEGDKPQHAGFRELDPWTALDELERIAAEDDEFWREPPWIVNVDLDYFTARQDVGTEPLRVFDDAYVAAIGRFIAAGLREGRIGCATLALSPETTGGWPLAEHLMAVFLSEWGDGPALASS